jgi:hypothetical protein
MAAAGALHLVSHVISYAGASFIESRGDAVTQDRAQDRLAQPVGSI